MAEYGVLAGILLLVALTSVCMLLAFKAEANIRRFREEHYEQFLGERKR
jgi:hypothetical protein